jgi:hypothetical protein
MTQCKKYEILQTIKGTCIREGERERESEEGENLNEMTVVSTLLHHCELRPTWVNQISKHVNEKFG